MNIDPRLLSEIIRQGDPREELLAVATAFAEGGGRLDAVGDGGHSGGPFQENDWGRGAGIPMAQRMEPRGAVSRFLRELRRFKARGYRGAELAYATQRPADRAGYVKKISQYLRQAPSVLAGATAAPDTRLMAPAADAGTGPRSGALPADLVRRLARWQRDSETEALAGRDLALPAGTVEALNAARRVSALPPASPATPASPESAPPPPGDYRWARQLGDRFGLRLASTYRDPARNAAVGGSRTSAHMTRGGATDFAGSPAAMRRLAEWAIRSGQFSEVFFDPVGQWDQGRFSPRGIGGHSDHVHISR